MASSRERASLIPLPRCPFCHDSVPRGAVAIRVCPGCHAFHHEECWRERGACASCSPVRLPVAGAHQAPVATPQPPEALRERVAGRVRLRERLAAIRAARRRNLALGVAGLALFFGGIVLGGWQRSQPWSRDPSSVALAYAEALRASAHPSAAPGPGVEAYLTPLSATLAKMEGGTRDLPLDLLRPFTAEVTFAAGESRPLRAVVHAGGHELRAVPDDQMGWVFDRTLADEPVEACGVRLRLPLGLEPVKGSAHEWRQGDLVVSLARESFAVPLAAARLAPPRLDDVPMGEGGPSASGVRIFSGQDGASSAAIAYVETALGSVVTLELRGPPSREVDLIALVRESVATIAPADSPVVHEPEKVRRIALDGQSSVEVTGALAPDESVSEETVEAGSEKLTVADVVRRMRAPDGRLFSHYEVEGSLLPWRAAYLVPAPDGATGDTFALVAVGVVEGRGVILTVRGPAGVTHSRAALARLDRIASSYVVGSPSR